VFERAWDDETMALFAKSDRFNVLITNVNRRRGFGTTRPDEGSMHRPDGYEVSGVILYPKLILVSVEFEGSRDNETLGTWFYHLYNHSDSPAKKVDIPFLDMSLMDKDETIRRALFEGHHAALLSGRRYSFVRFWKRPGDGVMTQKDREHGYSYESRYPLIGMYTWAQLEAPSLPAWAVPYENERFSLKNVPERYDLSL
jgi:hypothetical protein